MGHTIEGYVHRRLVLVLEYEGTQYHGFQFQLGASSIQGELEASIAQLTGERVRVAAAGRTDAGVHALGQVVAFSTRTSYETKTFRQALNHYLPRDIVVRTVLEAPVDFDPRRQALSRTYRYVILNRNVRSPVWRGFAYHMPDRLHLERVEEAMKCLEGASRDFAPFSGPLGTIKTTVRRLLRTQIWSQDNFVTIEMEGNAFLPQQVRRMIGTAVRVGTERMTQTEFREIADSGKRGAAQWVAPAHGLYLAHVQYPAGTLCEAIVE